MARSERGDAPETQIGSQLAELRRVVFHGSTCGQNAVAGSQNTVPRPANTPQCLFEEHVRKLMVPQPIFSGVLAAASEAAKAGLAPIAASPDASEVASARAA